MSPWNSSLLIIPARRPHASRRRSRGHSGEFPEELWPDLLETMIIETIKKAMATHATEVAVCFGPVEERPYFQQITEGRIPLIAQRGSRPQRWVPHAMDDGLYLGYSSISFLVSDVPGLPMAALRDALRELVDPAEPVNALLGPDPGGFYLIGLQQPDPELFHGIDWSSNRGFTELRDRLQAAALTLRELPPMEDVDSPADAERLLQQVRQDPAAWRRLAPVTCRFFERHGLLPAPPEADANGSSNAD